MPRKPLVLLLSYLITLSMAQAQTGHVAAPPTVDQGVTPQSMDVGTPDQVGDADPLDVLEPKKEATPIEPTVPQFTEIPEPGAKSKEPPPPEVKTEPAPEVAAPKEPVAPAPVPEAPPLKKVTKKKKAEKIPAVVNNDPDVNRETRFHNIYKKYNEQPTSDEAWEKASGTRKGEVYKVQKGDTLWAVSNTFFADANYWPKLWSLNVGQIGNPHEIDPRMSIQFFPGTMADAPTLGLVEKTSTEMSEAPKVASNSEELSVPAPKPRKHAPLLENIPSSIPTYRYGKVMIPPTTLDLPSLQKNMVGGREYLSYYVADHVPASVGTITETELGMNTATEFQYVIIKLEHPDASLKSLVAVKEMEKLKYGEAIFKNAHLIEVQGSIEILEKVHDSKNLYRAVVKKSIQPLDVGAQLILGPLPNFDPTATSVSNGVHALIVGGEYESDRQQYQSNMILFLNAGRAQGVHEGQSFAVYSDMRNRNEGTSAQVNDRRVGTVKVIRVAEAFSTAYVTGAQDDIFVGDHVGIRNPGTSASAAEIEDGNDINKAPKSDLVPSVQEPAASAPSPDSSDFEL